MLNRQFRVGDLVAYDHAIDKCGVCFLCRNSDPCVGIVTEVWGYTDHEPSIIVEFPTGEWVFREYSMNDLTIL